MTTKNTCCNNCKGSWTGECFNPLCNCHSVKGEEKCACQKSGFKDHCLACEVTKSCLCGTPKEGGISATPKTETWEEKCHLMAISITAMFDDGHHSSSALEYKESNVEALIKANFSQEREQAYQEGYGKGIEEESAKCHEHSEQARKEGLREALDALPYPDGIENYRAAVKSVIIKLIEE